jgi:hypothetical protein
MLDQHDHDHSTLRPTIKLEVHTHEADFEFNGEAAIAELLPAMRIVFESDIGLVNAWLLQHAQRLEALASHHGSFPSTPERRSTPMANEQTKALIGRIDTATNGIAERIRRLKEVVKPGMTDAEVAEVNAGLEAEASRLEGIASDPDNPVPTEPPVDPTGEGGGAGASSSSRTPRPTD